MNNKLNEIISQLAYILDSLIVLRNIQDTGCCNDCHNLHCEYIPNPGAMVRYNCPFYKAESEVAQDADSN